MIGVDPTGFDVEATDGNIGKVDEATNEAGRGFLVVDTGFWISGKKRMIAASTVDRDERRIYLALTKEQVKQAPDYDEVRRDEESHRAEVESHYDRTRTASSKS